MKRLGRRGLVALAAFGAGLALAVVPSMGANVDVTATASDTFNPKTVTVTQGDSVTWTNVGGGFHNVKFDDGSYTQPAAPDPGDWKVSRTFTSAGTHRYYCEAHGSAGGVGMSGTVVVNPVSGTTTPTSPTSPTTPTTPGSVTDKSAPTLSLSVRRSQRILRRRGLVISVRVDEPATVTAKARVTVPGGSSRILKLRKATRRLQAGERARLKLRLPRKTRRAVTSALARRSRLRAKVSVTARDSADNTRRRTRSLIVRK
jgi:plastocyanin